MANALERDLVRNVRRLLGAKLTAYIARVADTHTLERWYQGDDVPPPESVERLQEALNMSCTILDFEGYNTRLLQAWMQGKNPAFDDLPPAKVIRDGGGLDG